MTVDSNIVNVSTTEECVLNPKYEGWRYARIEVYIEGEHYPQEVGYIRVYDNPKLFEAIRDKLEI